MVVIITMAKLIHLPLLHLAFCLLMLYAAHRSGSKHNKILRDTSQCISSGKALDIHHKNVLENYFCTISVTFFRDEWVHEDLITCDFDLVCWSVHSCDRCIINWFNIKLTFVGSKSCSISLSWNAHGGKWWLVIYQMKYQNVKHIAPYQTKDWVF